MTNKLVSDVLFEKIFDTVYYDCYHSSLCTATWSVNGDRLLEEFSIGTCDNIDNVELWMYVKDDLSKVTEYNRDLNGESLINIMNNYDCHSKGNDDRPGGKLYYYHMKNVPKEIACDILKMAWILRGYYDNY